MPGATETAAATAFLPGARARVASTASGPLSGARFAVKDLIDIAGQYTGAGNPGWPGAAKPARRTASAVGLLLAAGAAMDGRTVSDEFAFSLEGDNMHYPTVLNPAAQGRLPGGSSSGSAAAVAAAAVDFALGTDTGGSVRIPGAFCGIPAFRPTHGLVPLDGVFPFAPGYDTVGWFASDSRLLRKVGEVLLKDTKYVPIERVLVAADAFALADPQVADLLLNGVDGWEPAGDVSVFAGQEADFLEAYRVLQGHDVHRTVGEKLVDLRPAMAPPIARRFKDAQIITDADAARWQPYRDDLRARLDSLLPPGTAILIPTAPTAALPREASEAQIGEFYRRALTLCSISGHAGLPQRHFPAALLDNCPVGFSLIGGRGSDLGLLAASPND